MFRGSDRSNLSTSDMAAPSVHLDLAYWRSYVMSKQLPSVGVARARVTSASFYVRPKAAAAATRLAWLVSGVAGPGPARPRQSPAGRRVTVGRFDRGSGLLFTRTRGRHEAADATRRDRASNLLLITKLGPVSYQRSRRPTDWTPSDAPRRPVVRNRPWLSFAAPLLCFSLTAARRPCPALPYPARQTCRPRSPVIMHQQPAGVMSRVGYRPTDGQSGQIPGAVVW